MRGIDVLILVVVYLNFVAAFYPKVSIVNDESTVSKWIKASKNFDTIAWSQKDTLTSFIEKILSSDSSKNVSSDCINSLKYVESGLRQRTLWSYECKLNQCPNLIYFNLITLTTVVDAFSKGDVSYSKGDVGDIGKPDTCVRVHVEGSKESGIKFDGKYCLVSVNLPVPTTKPVKSDPMTAVHLNVSNTNLSSTVYEYYADRLEYFYQESFSFGICVPTTCSREDITTVLDHISQGTELIVSLRPHCDSYELRKSEKAPIEAKVSMAVILGLILLVIFSTGIGILFDTCEVRNKWTFLQHFNAINSHKKLVEVSTNDAQLRMRPMEAFITIAQVFAVAGHGLVAGKLFPTSFPAFMEYSDNFVDNGYIKLFFFYMAMGAQCFFAIAGFFNCYIVYPMMVKAYGGQWPPECAKEKTIESKYKNARKPVHTRHSQKNGRNDDVHDSTDVEDGQVDTQAGKKGSGIPFHLFLLKRWLRTIPTLGFMILVTLSTSEY